MKIRTTINQLTRLPILALAMLSSAVGLENANAQQSFLEIATGSACHAGFTGTWIIGEVCNLDNGIDLKSGDAVDIQCDSQTGRWRIDFYVEPAGADPNAPVSQATQYALCPSNGYLSKDASGKQMLHCNYWEPAGNVVKQLEFELLAMTDPGIRSMSWLTREQDNPNVVCGVAGRPEGGTGEGSAGQTVN